MAGTIEYVEAGDKARRIRLTAYGLLGAAVLTPYLVSWVSGLSAFDTGRLLGQMLITLLLALIALGVALRGRSAVVKSYGRLVIGICFIGWAIAASVTAWRDTQALHDAKQELATSFLNGTVAATQPDVSVPASVPPLPAKPLSPTASATEKKVAFTKGVQGLLESQAAKFEVLSRKFDAVDLTTVLAGGNLVSADGIATSRVKIKRVLSLVKERDAVVQQYVVDVDTYFKTADIDEFIRQEAISTFEAGKLKTLKSFADLSAAQSASMNAVLGILDLAETNLGKTSMRNGQILFASQGQRDQYTAQVARVRTAAAREQEAAEALAEVERQSRQAVMDSLDKR